MGHAHEMADGCAGPGEPGPIVLASIPDCGGQHVVDGRFGGIGVVKIERRQIDTFHGWHILSGFHQVGQVVFQRFSGSEGDQKSVAVLVINGPRYPDGLVHRTEMGVATRLHGDEVA